MLIYKGKLKIGDKEYNCEVKNGIRYIDGKTIDEFLSTLDIEYVLLLNRIGQKKFNEILTGKKKPVN